MPKCFSLFSLKKYNIVNIKTLTFSLADFNSYLINSCFSSSSINIKKKFRDVSHFLGMCVIFLVIFSDFSSRFKHSEEPQSFNHWCSQTEHIILTDQYNLDSDRSKTTSISLIWNIKSFKTIPTRQLAIASVLNLVSLYIALICQLRYKGFGDFLLF